MLKFTLKAVTLTAVIAFAPGIALAQTAQLPSEPPKVQMTPGAPAAPGLTAVPGAPIPLVDGAFLPDGQKLHLGPGETAHAIPRADGSIDHVIVDFQDGMERMRLTYKQGSEKLLTGEEHRADGTLKWKTMPTYGGPPSIVRYWPKPNDGKMYTITEKWGNGGKRIQYMRPGAHSFVLTREWDAAGKQVDEAVLSDVYPDNLKYQWSDVPGEGLHVTYFFEDLGTVDFRQLWKSLPGTPEPQVNVSWTDDNGANVSYDVTLTSDGSRAVKVVYKDKAGDEVTDEVTADGKYIAARKVVSAKTQKVIKDVTYTGSKPRLQIPDRYFDAPPKPVDPVSMGLSDPD